MEAARDHPDIAAFARRTVDAQDTALLDGAGDAYHISGRSWRPRIRVLWTQYATTRIGALHRAWRSAIPRECSIFTFPKILSAAQFATCFLNTGVLHRGPAMLSARMQRRIEI